MNLHSIIPILKKASKLSFFILLNKPIGFLRDILQTRYFGLTLLSDSYIAAWRIPNVFRRIFGEGLLSSILLPELVKIKEKESEEVLFSVLTIITLITQIIVFMVCVLIAFHAKKIVELLSLGSPERIVYGATMLRILIFFTFFITWSSIQSIALQLKNNFYLGPQSQFILNIALCIEFFIASRYDISYPLVATMITANGIIVLGIHSFAYRYYQFRYCFPSKKSFFLSIHFFKKFFLALTTNLLLESNSFISLSLSSYLKPGLLTLFETLLTLIRLPQQIFGNALATTANIELISLVNNKSEKLESTLQEIMKFFILISLICSIGIFVFGKLFFKFFFMITKISPEFIPIAYSNFFIMSLSLFPALGTKILITFLYATENIMLPTIISFLVTFIQNFGLAYFLNQYGLIALTINYFLFDWVRFFLFLQIIQTKYNLRIIPPLKNLLKK